MNRRRLLQRLHRGTLNNISFTDFTNLLRGYGFELNRVNGSHHIFVNPDINEIINIQEVRREVKPYQIRQFLRLVAFYDIQLEE